MDQLRDGIAEGTAGQILTRAAARFAGEAPEPRKGLRAGHIPGSRNPLRELFDEDGKYQDANDQVTRSMPPELTRARR